MTSPISAGGIAAFSLPHDLPEHGVIHVSAAIVADDAANIFRQRIQISDQVFRALAAQLRMFLQLPPVQLGDVSSMVLVMVQVHGCSSMWGSARYTIRQRRDFMGRYGSLCHF